jgi:hypothetical protein
MKGTRPIGQGNSIETSYEPAYKRIYQNQCVFSPMNLSWRVSESAGWTSLRDCHAVLLFLLDFVAPGMLAKVLSDRHHRHGHR